MTADDRFESVELAYWRRNAAGAPQPRCAEGRFNYVFVFIGLPVA
jgi:hypothetical protein